MSNPYLIDGPAIVSFSGGRTSAYMLAHIVEAHGGRLPENVFAVFANTGKERPETLRFVHDVGQNLGVPVYWLEFQARAPGFQIVGFNSASRDGEPFKALIDKKRRLPNGRERWCTELLKVRPIHAFAQSVGLIPGEFVNVIGLRHDEGHRILKGYASAEKYGQRVAYPLAKAKVVKADIMAFWRGSAFDLQLEPWEGNCDLCFLKGVAIRRRIVRDRPESAVWWHARETETGGRFSSRETVLDIIQRVGDTPELFDIGAEEFDAECGLSCSWEDAG
jgi:hypothetical protein